MRHRLVVAGVLGILLVLGFAAEAQQTAPPESPKQEVQTPPAADKSATASPAAALSEKPVTQEQLQALVQRAVRNDLENFEAYKNLTHVERVQTEHLDDKDKVKKTETVTREVFILYGERVEHVIERDDKPLPADEAKKEQEKFDKEVAKLKDESPEKRQKRMEKFREEIQKDRESISDAANAFDFTLLGEEMVNGRPAYVLQGEPRPNYKAKTRAGEVLKKVRGKIWIDIAATHWVKMDIEFTDTYSYGWVVARLRKGTRVQIEQVLFRDDVWVPREVDIKIDARVALFKQYFANVNMKYRDWRQFSAQSKITGFAEMDQQKADQPKQESPRQQPPPQSPQ